MSAFRVKLGADDLNCVDVLLKPTHSLTVSDVGDSVHDTEKESIRNRGCRLLANLCQTAACCDIIHEDHADVLGTIVSHLSKTTDKDCQVTYCRTIRYSSKLLRTQTHAHCFNGYLFSSSVCS